ncbi:hypothetical protein HY572_06195 [Candidatus Micrarchaeota archaeon]|nr:hypothetical protein [Candidatus Micrarchaeota archaeon]
MKHFEYVVVFVAVMALAFAFFVYAPGGVQKDAGGNVLAGGQNFQFYQQKAAALGNECGDLNDESNVQHLSHHPDRYADCLKQVEPGALQKATGKTLQQIVG